MSTNSRQCQTTAFSKRGDTIIEVLFAIAIFGFVAVLALTIMQKGVNAAQTALEVTLARNEMNSQAEALRFINAGIHSRERDKEPGEQDGQYVGLWREVLNIAQTNNRISDFDTLTEQGQCKKASDINRNAFVLDTKNRLTPSSNIEIATIFPRLVYGAVYGAGEQEEDNVIKTEQSVFARSEGIWIEAARVDNQAPTSGGANLIAYDFHIRACWVSPSSSRPMTLATIIRLHDVEVKR